jgi:hypothetical protein
MKWIYSFFLLLGIYSGLLSGDDLSLWETGGMYFCVPYAKGTLEYDGNFWFEDEGPGMSLYGSCALSDHFRESNVSFLLKFPLLLPPAKR